MQFMICFASSLTQINIMGKVFDTIDENLKAFIENQQMFFVGSAPLTGDGHINVSPKGLDTFRIIDETTVAYLDYYGSGIETVAHMKENGRIVIMFCAFEGPPKIVRLHGRGEAILSDHPDFESLLSNFPDAPHVRSIVRINCQRISDSCGYGVPRYEFVEQREQLDKWGQVKDAEAVAEYGRTKNVKSLDGLPGL